MERLWGYVVSAVLLGATLYPLQTHPRRDSFPLSTYPMFSKARPEVAEIDHVIGYGASGERVVVPPELIGSGEILQAKALLTAAVRRGRQASRAVCETVAARVAAASDLAWVERLEVRTDSFQVLGYFTGGRQPLRSSVHAQCEVKRGAR